MSSLMRLAALAILACGWGFAESWSGALVDWRCFESEEHNVNPTDTLTNVDRDRNWETRFCTPRLKSKSFAFVGRDGQSLQLDSEGNRKAAELVQKAGKKDLFLVVINGERSGHKLMVDSIEASK